MEDYKKKYEEALDNFKKIKAANKYNNELVDFIEYKYPELKENEDEKIRKELIKVFEERVQHSFEWKDGIPNNAVIAWLEKQGEQKQNVIDIISDLENYFATTTKEQQKKDWDEIKNWEEKHFNHDKHIEPKPAWSEEDGDMIESLNNCLDELEEVNGWLYTYVNDKDVKLEDIRNWLKSIKDRVQPQPKQEWNKEDERLIEFLIAHFSVCHPYRSFKFDINTDLTTDEIIERISNLSPQSQWKPSDEQMTYLSQVMDRNDYCGSVLYSLYQELKRL